MRFLLVWDRDCYTGSFLCVVSMHICITTPVGSSLPILFNSPYFLVLLVSLRFLYSFLNHENINHIQVFGFLPLSFPSQAWPPLSMTHIP
jgi:uncharacterized membrane protein